MTRWSIRYDSDRVLEPSAGDAAFLVSAGHRLRQLGATIRSDQLHGVELHQPSVSSATGILNSNDLSANIEAADFFDVEPSPEFDVVVGNPPFIRYQDFQGASRAKSQEAALAQGVRLTSLANSWAAFVIHSSAFLNDQGRLALVIPAELLTVNYAQPVRQFLLQRFASVRVLAFEERVFPGVTEEVVLLLAEGRGPTDHIEIFQARSLESLAKIDELAWLARRSMPNGRWTEALLPSDAARIYHSTVSGGAFAPLSDWGHPTLGMVTGANNYFTLTSADVQLHGLTESDVERISPPGSRHLRGLSLTASKWQRLRDSGDGVYLFSPDVDDPSNAALRYISLGEEQELHLRYKCRVRDPWWKVPSVPTPDLFLTYMNHDAPRLVANRARLRYLNSVHGVVIADDAKRLGKDYLPIAALNSVTVLGAELVGRSYGGGILKLEPGEARRWPVPTPKLIGSASSRLAEVRPRVVRRLATGDLEGAIALIDQVLLVDEAGIDASTVELLAASQRLMFARRKSRGRHAASQE